MEEESDKLYNLTFNSINLVFLVPMLLNLNYRITMATKVLTNI